MSKIIFIFILLFSYTSFAHAYLGPGVGFGILAASVGIIIAIFAALIGIIWYPIKKIMNKKKEKKNDTNNSL